MISRHKDVSANDMVIAMFVLINAIIIKLGFITSEHWYGLLWISVPALLLAIIQRHGITLPRRWRLDLQG